MGTISESKRLHEILGLFFKGCFNPLICAPKSQKWKVLFRNWPSDKGEQEWATMSCSGWWMEKGSPGASLCVGLYDIIFIMLNIYICSWVLQLGIIFPLCSTLCVEMQGKNDPMMNISNTPYTFICQLPKNIETRLNELRSPLYLSNAALLWQCSWLDRQDWLSVKGSTLSVSPQDNILEASCKWLMVSKLG